MILVRERDIKMSENEETSISPMVKTNPYGKQIQRAERNRIKLCQFWGGKCRKCGYDKNYAALEFCLLSGKEHTFPLNERNLGNRSWEALVAEVRKCGLLCKNCKTELEQPKLANQQKKPVAR